METVSLLILRFRSKQTPSDGVQRAVSLVLGRAAIHTEPRKEKCRPQINVEVESFSPTVMFLLVLLGDQLCTVTSRERSPK